MNGPFVDLLKEVVMRYLIFLLLAFSLLACEAKKENKEEKSEKTEKEDKDEVEKGNAGEAVGGDEAASGDEAGLKDMVLLDLGIKAKLPADTQLSDMMGEVMIQAPGCVLTVGLPRDSEPADMAATKQDFESTYGAKEFKEEPMVEGWAITFQNEGSAGTNYFMEARRKVGEKEYSCSVLSPRAEHQACGLEVCRSLIP